MPRHDDFEEACIMRRYLKEIKQIAGVARPQKQAVSGAPAEAPGGLRGAGCASGAQPGKIELHALTLVSADLVTEPAIRRGSAGRRGSRELLGG